MAIIPSGLERYEVLVLSTPRGVSFSERRLSLLRVEVYEALATATGEIRVWLRL